MKTPLLFQSAALSAVLIAGGLIFTVTPANAAAISINCTTTASMVQVPEGDTVEITGCTFVDWSSSPSTVTNIVVSAGGLDIPKNRTESFSGTLTVSGIRNTQNATLTLRVSSPTGTPYQVSLAGTPAANANIAPSKAAVIVPEVVSLTLDLAASGASCTDGSAVSGVVGGWMTLPAADACTSTTRPSAKLLGWSTNAGFPVALAQSQVNKGWGAIDDTFNGVRMIFIPAGQATFVSGSNSLHPIWAS